MTSVHKMQMGLSAYNLQIVDLCLKNCSTFFTMCACVCFHPATFLPCPHTKYFSISIYWSSYIRELEMQGYKVICFLEEIWLDWNSKTLVAQHLHLHWKTPWPWKIWAIWFNSQCKALDGWFGCALPIFQGNVAISTDWPQEHSLLNIEQPPISATVQRCNGIIFPDQRYHLQRGAAIRLKSSVEFSRGV